MTFVVTQGHVPTQTNHGPGGYVEAPVDSLRQAENDNIDHDPLLDTFTMILRDFFGDV